MREPLSEVLRPADFSAPSPDASQLLRGVPGFALSRVGGAAADPLLRGLNGTRVQIVADGMPLEGACSHRMDPPTSYLAASSFDRVVVTKGPSTVRYGAPVAGAVEFQRDPARPSAFASRLGADVQAGSFQQWQAGADAQLSGPRAALRASARRAESGNYRDGSGTEVHSFYDRYNADLAATWFVADGARLEVTGETGDGRAAFPTFHMDGTRFLRNRVGARAVIERPSGAFARLEARFAVADTDHRMDDYSLRPTKPLVSDFGGITLTQITRLDMDQSLDARSAAVESTWRVGERATWLIGVDQAREHYLGRNRTASSSCLDVFGAVSCTFARRTWTQYDLSFDRVGVFGEAEWWATDTTRLKAGVRRNVQETTAGLLFDFIGANPQPGSGSARSETSTSGFLRAETAFSEHWSGFAALGTTQRPAYGLERAIGGFFLQQERSRQIDAGIAHATARSQVGLDVFANRIDDFVLIVQGTSSRNVDAAQHGGEFYITRRVGERVRASMSASWVHADNLTDRRALAQTPPPELKLGIEWRTGAWTLTGSGRLVARQDRVDVGAGNVTGVDLGPTAGFGVWGLRASWQPRESIRFTAGIDNLFDRTYAEHLNRTGGFAPLGFVPSFRVNEPGRLFWLKGEVRF
jgi:iron complex outermembrane receptor protein